MSRVSINLLTLNGAKYLKNCLNSILGQTYRDFSLKILDNGSQDQSAAIIKNFLPKFKNQKINAILNCQNKNIGFAKGHNALIEQTQSNYVLVLNQDIILDQNYLKKLIMVMESGKRVGSCAGISFQLTEGRKTATIDSAGLRHNRGFKFTEIGAGVGKEDFFKSTVGTRFIASFVNVFGVSASAALYRRTALENIKDRYNNYFDADFFSYKEDIDLAWRLQKAGWLNLIAPRATYWHERGAKNTQKSVRKNRRAKSAFTNYHSYKNHLFLLVKNLTRKQLITHFPFIVWYEAKKNVYIFFLEPKTLFGLAEFFKKLPKMIRKRITYCQ